MTASTHAPCVCVHIGQENSGGVIADEGKPQEGDVCKNTYTLIERLHRCCCCCVASQSTSSSRGACPQSTSRLLALPRWV